MTAEMRCINTELLNQQLTEEDRVMEMQISLSGATESYLEYASSYPESNCANTLYECAIDESASNELLELLLANVSVNINRADQLSADQARSIAQDFLNYRAKVVKELQDNKDVFIQN